jgi:hypothetical protein
MKKLTLLIAIMVSLSFVARAQMNFGVKAGLNMATLSGDDVENASMKPNYQVGGVLNFNVTDAISLQPGLILAGKGSNNSENSDFTLSMNYLEIPVNAVYNISGFQVFAGPYLGLGLFGKEKYADDDYDIEFTSDVDPTNTSQDKSYYNSFDYGINAGLGYKLNDAIQIQANYGLGLANVFPKVDGQDPSIEANNSVIQLTVSYFL